MDKKSLEFVKGVLNLEYPERRFVELDEVLFPDFIKLYTGFCKEWEHDRLTVPLKGCEEETKDKGFVTVIRYDTEAEFTNMLMNECICDGSRSYQTDVAIELLLNAVECKLSCALPTEPEEYWEYDRIYTVGNFVYGTERGEEFADAEHPGCKTKYSVMLPVHCELIKKSGGNL